MQITTIGLDIAKNVFQVHGIDANEKVVVRKQLRRSQVLAFFKALPPFLIGMEACATAHYWARELRKLGHTVRLMPARVLVVGAHAVLKLAKQHPEKYLWLTQLLARKPFKVVAVALANKMARTAWALLAHGGTYQAPRLAAAA